MSAAGKVHPDDILVLASLAERRDYRHMDFGPRQIFTVQQGARAFEGRRFRTAWITPFATRVEGAEEVFIALGSRVIMRHPESSLRPVSEWEPEPLNLIEQIRALPEDANFRGAKDAGYRLAIDDVLELLERELG